METNPSLTALLLTVRTLGDQNIVANHEAFKGFKKELILAQEQGLLAAGNASVPTVGKDGTTKMKKAKVVGITEAGAAFLQHAASPEAHAAARVGMIGAALEKDRAALREQVLASVKPAGKAKADPSKEIKELLKQVAKLTERLEKLEGSLQAESPGTVLTHIDAAFAQLSAKLTGGAVPAAPAPVGSMPTPAPTAPALAKLLEDTYRHLCRYTQYEDGLVDLPRLYHEMKQKMPSLTVADYHKELLELWEKRTIELKIANEIRLATEPQLGIQQGENLYYHVLWKRS